MKILHLGLVAIVFATGIAVLEPDEISAYASTPTNDLGDGNIFSMTVNGTFFPSNYLEIKGNLVTVDPIKITLDNPQGIVVASKTTFSDRTGNFISELKIPDNATSGTWDIIGTSGIYHKELNFTIADNSVSNTCYAGDLCPSVLHMVSNATSACCYIHGTNSTIIQSPLEQFRANIATQNVECGSSLTLVIKAEDGSPACIKQDSVVKLIQRGWMSVSFQDPTDTIPVESYQTIDNNSGTILIKNQTYYIMTATNTTYPVDPAVTVKFHQVIFSFPYGALATPGGAILPFDMTFPDGTTEAYGKITRNADGSDSMLSGIGLGPGPSSNRTAIRLSEHIHPQSGIIMTENQIKLLVSTDANSITQTSTQNYNPFGITALVIYKPTFGCPVTNDTAAVICPQNSFYLKINSASTTYLLGYNICDGNSCTKSDGLSVSLPINSLQPNYQLIALPADLQWKDGDTTKIQLEISPTLDNKTRLQISYENSTIVPQ